MSYGLQIVNANGKVFATPETPFFHMTARKQLAVSGVNLGSNAIKYNTGISSGLRMACYTKCSANIPCYMTQYAENGTWWLAIHSSGTATLTFYFFTNSIPASSGSWGMDFFDANGTRVYSTSTKPLQNFQTTLDRINKPSVQVGFSAAVIAMPCQYWVQPIQGGMNVQFMIGMPVAYNTQIDLGVVGTGIMPGGSTFGFAAFGGMVNYINTALYD